MKKVLKKSLAFILALTMVFGAAPLAGLVGIELPSIKDVFTDKAEAAEFSYGNVNSGGKLEYVTIEGTMTACVSGFASNGFPISGNVVIPATVNEYTIVGINEYAFLNSSIVSVSIPETVTVIGRSAFNHCESLKSITIPSSVTTIGESAFAGSGLTSITIPDSVTSLGKSAFNGCTSLESFCMGLGITVIPESCFNGCTALTDAALGENVITIEYYAFAGCTSLTSIKIPFGVTSMVGSFGDCTALESIYIPHTVNTIGEYCFYNAGSLTDVYYSGTEEQWNSINIKNDYSSNGALVTANFHYEDYEHDPHRYIITVIKKETCTTEGTYDCYCPKCGYKCTETKDALGHDLEMIARKEATCTENGNIAYYRCKVCGELFADGNATTPTTLEKTVIPAQHKLEHVASKEATCTENGNIEYWKCTACEKLFADEKAETEITLDDTVIPAKGHSPEYVEPKEATCTEDGNTEHYKCYACGKLFADEKAETEITPESIIIPANGHTLDKTERKEATCTEDGNIEYWECTVCKKLYKDEEATTEITFEETVIPASHSLEHVARKEATCTEDGNIEYWECAACTKLFADEEATIEITLEETIIPAHHKLAPVARKEATCTKSGNIAHYRCTVCGKLFTDENATTEIAPENTIISPKGHSLIAFARNEATCTENGNTAYWQCTVCGELFADENAITAITLKETVIPATGHSLYYVSRKEPTCTNKGNIAHYKCSACGELFADGNATTAIAYFNTLIPALGHTEGEWKIEKEPTYSQPGRRVRRCTVCGEILDIETIAKLDAGSISIRTPSRTSIDYGDSIILHLDIDRPLPDGAHVEWSESNGNFDMSVSADGMTCKISPKSNGKTVFTVSVYDKDGNVINSATQEMTAKAGLWQKVVAFFKNIFGMTRTIPEAFKGIL